MTVLLFMLLTLIIIAKDEYNINESKKKNDKTADESMRSFRETMDKLREIREKDHREP